MRVAFQLDGLEARGLLVILTTELQSGSKGLRSGFLPDRVIHLHPTRLCNLACLHCYSESNPRQKTALDPRDLSNALYMLRAEEYVVISLSGGEPLRTLSSRF